MKIVTVDVRFSRDRGNEVYKELHQMSPSAPIRRVGTDDCWIVEFLDRSSADLFAVNAAGIYGVTRVDVSI